MPSSAFRFDVTLKPPQAEHAVLRDVVFELQQGRTTAVLGLSGCGKTLLLQLVGCRLNLASFGFQGSVELPQAFKDRHGDGSTPATAGEALDRLRPHVAYVPPDDIVFGFDTPREAVVFRHRLAFGSTAEEAAEAAEALLEELGLAKCADNLIAPGVGLRGISGGQRRRTCIAMALVTRPAVLVLDEPTTGLDSHTAKQVMSSVQLIAQRYECAVVQSLQQPGSDLFPFFDDVVLLRADGSLEYAGPTADGPASIPKAHRAVAEVATAWKDPTEPIDSFADENAEAAAADEEAPPPPTTPVAPAPQQVIGSASMPTVAMLVMMRHFRALLRNPLALVMRVAQALLLAIFFGVVFWDLDTTADNFKQVLGFLMIFVTASFIPVQTGAAVFPMEKDVFLEEQKLPYRYPAWLYGASKFLTESCAQFPLSVAYAGIMGSMVGFPSDAVGGLILSALLQTVASESFGFFVSTVVPPAIAIGVVTPVTAFIMMVVGTSLASGQGATSEIFDVMKAVSFLRNGYAAVALDVIPLVQTPCSRPGYCFFNTADEALHFYDLDGTTQGQEWGLLFMWAVLFRLAAAAALTQMGWSQRVTYDVAKHRRAALPVGAEAEGHTAVSVGADAGAHPGLGYAPEPGPMELRWDVKFSVRPRFGEGSDSVRVILQRMCGVASAGRTLAIMGGSGAGKSTLLEALSLRLPSSSVFTEVFRETVVDVLLKAPAGGATSEAVAEDVGAEARALIGFVHQDPQFITGLSALEVAAFAVAAAAPAGTTSEQCEAETRALLAGLGLAHVADAEAQGMSGSQRKRLAVIVAMAQKRPVLMLDEPTSGLDPESAHRLLQMVHELAHEQRVTVLYTLHQPGDELLPFIDDLLLLSAGRVVYHGALADAEAAFEGYDRPAGANATDHYLELAGDAATVEKLVARWEQRSSAEAPMTPAASAGGPARIEAKTLCAPHAGLHAPLAGFAALTKRCFTATVLRANKLSLAGRFLALYVAMPLTIGVAMYDQADNVVSLQNGAFMYMMGISFASAMTPLLDLHLERVTFLRDQEGDVYSPVAYCAAFTLSGLPLDTLGLLLGTGIVYGMVGFRGDAGSFFLFLAASFLQQQAAVGTGYVVGVLIHSLVVSAAMTTLCMVVFSTGAGVIVAPQTINDSVWMHSLEFISPTRSAMLIAVREEMRHRVGGEELIENVLGFDRAWDENWVLWVNLAVIAVATRLAAALMFKFTTRAASYRRSTEKTPTLSG